MTALGHLGQEGTKFVKVLTREDVSGTNANYLPSCPKCPNGVLGAVHDLLDKMHGHLAKTWLDTPSAVRRFVAAGAPEALERHGWSFWTDGDGGCRLERLEGPDGNADLPARWIAERCQDGGELPLWQAYGSYRAWLIEHRLANPFLYPKEHGRLSSPSKEDAEGGKRALRRLGYRTTRNGEGGTRFVGVSLKPEPDMRPPTTTASDEGDPMAALLPVADMGGDPGALDQAYLRLSGERGTPCRRCGAPVLHTLDNPVLGLPITLDPEPATWTATLTALAAGRRACTTLDGRTHHRIDPLQITPHPPRGRAQLRTEHHCPGRITP